jgi:hypothetical protein
MKSSFANNSLKLLLLAGLTLILISAFLPSLAAAGALQKDACSQLDDFVGNPNQECSTGGSAFLGILHGLVLLISRIAGVVGVVMVILGGFRYITSGGDANKVSTAKTTLLYALIGVAVAALAQLLANYVINTAK